MKYKNFEEYLDEVYQNSSDSDGVLDDEMYDSFMDFVGELSPDELIEYGNAYAKIRYEEGIQEAVNNMPEPDYEPIDMSGASDRIDGGGNR